MQKKTVRVPHGCARAHAWLAILIILGVGSCAVLAGTESPAPAPGAPRAEVFGALPVQSDVELSPDGHWLAWLDQPAAATPHVVMFDLLTRKPQRVLTLPEGTQVHDLVWSDNETLIVAVHATVEIGATIETSPALVNTAFNVHGGEGVMLPAPVPWERGKVSGPVAAHLVRDRTKRPHTVVMTAAKVLMDVDTTTGSSVTTETGQDHTIGWAVDDSGTPVAREELDRKQGTYRLYALSTNKAREILSIAVRDQLPRLAGLLPDGSALVVLAANGHAHQAAWALAFDGSPMRLLAEDPDTDITRTFLDPYTGAVIGVYTGGSVHWMDATAESRESAARSAFPDHEVEVAGWTSDGAKTLARVQSPSAPPLYYLIDYTTHRADIAAEEYPALAGVRLGEFRQISYAARDGTTIPAYLTLPAGKPASPQPLVVLPHDGPDARDYPRFNWLVQFLATRGYAVLQPQFRGSTGLGKAFHEAGYRQWGGLMQDDLTDGVGAMIARGIADPHRICIVGMGYGGYAALDGAASTPKLYACAVSINGVSDLSALLAPMKRFYGDPATYYNLKEHIGAPGERMLVTRSPINSVGSITAPVLIAYGGGYPTLPGDQALRMADAMRKAGKQVTLVKLPDEDHWLSDTHTRVQLLNDLDAFLKQNL